MHGTIWSRYLIKHVFSININFRCQIVKVCDNQHFNSALNIAYLRIQLLPYIETHKMYLPQHFVCLTARTRVRNSKWLWSLRLRASLTVGKQCRLRLPLVQRVTQTRRTGKPTSARAATATSAKICIFFNDGFQDFRFSQTYFVNFYSQL